MRKFSMIVKSIWYSFRFSTSQTLKIPIRTSWITKIRLAKNASIIHNGVLALGLFRGGIGEFGLIKYDRTVLQLGENSKLITGKNVSIGPGVRIILGPDATLSIGENTYITANSTIICAKEVNIGSNCIISWNVQIMDSDFHSIIENGKVREHTAPIKIENNVWIGSGAIILKGVTLEHGSIIGSGSVVTKDTLPNSIVAGNPAKVIKENIKWNV